MFLYYDGTISTYNYPSIPVFNGQERLKVGPTIDMKKFFTPDEQLVIDALKLHPKSTAFEITIRTGLRRRGVLRNALDGLDLKGLLRHTDDRIERYYLVHAG
jgi:hypothetical protein